MSGTPSNCQTKQTADQVELQADATEIVPSVIKAVAEVRGEDELSFEPRLYDVIDPDAIKECVGSATTDIELSFEFASCWISINSDGEISVTEV